MKETLALLVNHMISLRVQLDLDLDNEVSYTVDIEDRCGDVLHELYELRDSLEAVYNMEGDK